MMKKEINNNEDKLIRDLFKDFTPDEAPKSVRQNAMNRILHEWVEQPEVYQPFINKKNRWWIIGAAVTVLAITFLVDATGIQQLLQNMGLTADIIDFKAINKSFTQSISYAANLPSLVYFVSFGILFLLGIDKALNRLANM